MNYKNELWYSITWQFNGSNIPWIFDLPEIKNPALSFLSINGYCDTASGQQYCPFFVRFSDEFGALPTMNITTDPTGIGPATQNGIFLQVNDHCSWRGLLPLFPNRQYNLDMYAIPLFPLIATDITGYSATVNYALSFDV
jgi:hypothetical protein